MNQNFGEGPVWKNVVAQAIPLTVAQLVQLLYNIVDRIYIGHLPGVGTTALTGIGLTFPIILFVTAFTSLFGMGGSPLCSIARGAGNQERAERVMACSFTLLAGSSLIIMAVCYLFMEPVLYLFGASDATYIYASGYLNIYLLGTVSVMIGSGMNYFINSQGFPRAAMVTTLLGAVLNLILDPVFIFLLDMGVQGAALATIISQTASAIWVMAFLMGKKPVLAFRKEYLRPQLKLVWEIISLGFSGFIMSATNCAVQIVCNITLKNYGGNLSDLYIGVMTVLNSVREILSLPVQGLTNGAQPVIGFNYGAKKYSRVKKAIAFSSIIGVIYTGVAWLTVLIFPEIFIRMFNDDPALLETGVHALHIYFFGFIFMTLQFSGQTAFVAMGKSKQAIFFSLLRKAFIVIPLTLVLPMLWNLGCDGVFWAEPISNLIGGTASFSVMMLTVWRKELSHPPVVESQS